jgi:O-antigen/teichoic acid export membrane protein
MAIRTSGFLTAFVFSWFLARTTGAAGAGQYYLAFSVVSLAYVATKLGTDNALVRLISTLTADEAFQQVERTYRAAVIAVGAASVLASALLLVLSPSVARLVFDDPGVSHPLRVMALGLPAMCLGSVVGRALLGSGWAVTGAMVEGGGLSVVQLALYVTGLRTFGVGGAAAALTVGNVVLLVAGIATWRRAFRPAGRTGVRITRRDVAALLRSALPFWWTDVLSVVSGLVGTVVLGVMSTAADAGVFAISNRVSKLGALALVPITTAISPRLARLHHTGDRSGLQRVYRATSTVLLAASAVATTAIIIGAPLFEHLYGAEFEGATGTLRLLALAYGLNVGLAGSIAVLQMTGHEQTVQWSMVWSTTIQIILSVALVRRFGAPGAAMAMLAAVVARNVYCSLSAWRWVHGRA